MQAIRRSVLAGAEDAAENGLILVRNREKHASGAEEAAEKVGIL
jgi:hypothetical protein